MTLAANSRISTATGNAVATTFPLSFSVNSAEELTVRVNNVVTTTGFAVVNGNSVVFTMPPANGVALVFLGNTPIEQLYDGTPLQRVQTEAIEQQLDKIVKVQQEYNTEVSRAAKSPFGVVGPLLPLPELGKALAWNTEGNLVNIASDSGAIAADVAAAEAAAVLAEAWAQSPTSPNGTADKSAKTIASDVAVAAAQVVTDRNTVAGDKAIVIANKSATDTNAANALASANTAAAAAAASLGKGYYPSAQTNLPRGVTGTSGLTAGSGGTNGTFALAFSGGNFAVNPTGTFTVAGGVLTAVTITGPGLYVGASPTAPTVSFAASAGLTGAAVTLTVDFLVQAGQYYWTDHASDASLLSAYYRSGSSPVISSPLATLAKTNYFNLLGSQKIGKATPVATGTSWVGNVSIIQPTPAANDGFIQSGTIVVNANTAAYVFAAELLSGSTFKRLTDFPKIVNLVTGVNDLSEINIPIKAGQYAAIFLVSGGTYYTNTGGTNSYYVIGEVGSSTATTAFGGVMEFNLTAENQTFGGQRVDAKNIADLQSNLGRTQTHGNIITPVTDRLLGYNGYTWISPYPAQFAGRAQRCLIDVNVAQQAIFKAITLNGDGTLTATDAATVSLSSAGSQELFFDLDVAAGQYVGVVLPLSGLGFSTTANPKLAWFSATEVTTSTARTVTTAWSTALQFTINSAILGDVRDHERRIDILEALPSALLPWAGEKWTALGDSLTAENNWTAPVAAGIGAALQNLGVSGGSFANNGDIRQTFPSIATGTKLITLMVQCNDFAGGVALGTRYTDYNGTRATFYAALYEAVTWLQANFPAARVVLLTEHAAGAGFGTAPVIAAVNARNLFATASGGTKVPDWQQAIQNVAADTGCSFIDVGREGGLGYFTSDASTTRDGLHPNAAGGQLWADYITPRLNAMKPVP